VTRRAHEAPRGMLPLVSQPEDLPVAGSGD
jgi:hypothetical protein